MNFEIKAVDSKAVYRYMADVSFPYHYPTDCSSWEKSYLRDVNGEGQTLFARLTSLGAFAGSTLLGYVQFGRTALGFDEAGEISEAVSYPVIRNFFFHEGREDVGNALLRQAVEALCVDGQRIYAFFHYFGMSCYARHGKLFEGAGYIGDLLIRNGFSVEHENVFYASQTRDAAENGVRLLWKPLTAGGCQSCEFQMAGSTVGGCEVHFLEQEGIAYLRWMYIRDGLRGQGVGSACMSALSAQLYHRGIRVLDTDTALTNHAAQRYYEKNGFARKGITRSYFMDVRS